MAELTNDDVLMPSALSTCFPEKQSAEALKETTDIRRNIILRQLKAPKKKLRDQMLISSESRKEDEHLLLLANLKPAEKVEIEGLNGIADRLQNALERKAKHDDK